MDVTVAKADESNACTTNVGRQSNSKCFGEETPLSVLDSSA